MTTDLLRHGGPGEDNMNELDKLTKTAGRRARRFVLELAEHGGDTPLPAPPLDLADPRYAIVMAGEAAALAVLLLDELAAAHSLTYREALDRFAPESS
jgi:hypothetical protein